MNNKNGRMGVVVVVGGCCLDWGEGWLGEMGGGWCCCWQLTDVTRLGRLVQTVAKAETGKYRRKLQNKIMW